MLAVHDPQVRLVLLNHVTVCLAAAPPEVLSQAGWCAEDIDSLTQRQVVR